MGLCIRLCSSLDYISSRGVYLDTDVLLHCSIDELLDCDCWLASDDVRTIATGLGFGAIKGHFVIRAMMEAYENYVFPSGTNVTRDTKVLESVLPEWEKSDRTSKYGNLRIVGMKDYGKYARHLYTYSWGSEEEQERALKNIEQNRKLNFWRKSIWKLKCAVRNPGIIAYMDRRKGSILEKIYTFCAYDLLDNGPLYYVKRMITRLERR